MQNSSLREQPREQRAPVIPSKHESSILDWLRASGRLISRETVAETQTYPEEEEEISGLIDPDDASYDDLSDDDDDFVDLES